jgi:hypothetical protein
MTTEHQQKIETETKRRYDHDGDDIIRDGEVLRVPMFAMDSLSPVQQAIARKSLNVTDGSGSTVGLHRPGFRIAMADVRRKKTVHYDPKGRLRGYSETEIETEEDEEWQTSDTMRDAAYEHYERELTTAWQGNRPHTDTAERTCPDGEATQDHYAAYDAWVGSQWRRG